MAVRAALSSFRGSPIKIARPSLGEAMFIRIPHRFRLSLKVLFVVAVLLAVKAGVHLAGLEFVALNGLIPSLVAGAVFIMGFMLSGIVTDYKQAETMPAEIRMAMEAIYDDIRIFAERTPGVDIDGLRRILCSVVAALETGLGGSHFEKDLKAAIEYAGQLSPFFAGLERLGMVANAVVRLRNEQDVLRRCLFRIYYIQKIEFVPSAHVLMQTLVTANVLLLMFLKAEGIVETAMIFGFVSYMLIYALLLIETLEEPFRKGHHSRDDVSIFLLREFVERVSAPHA